MTTPDLEALAREHEALHAALEPAALPMAAHAIGATLSIAISLKRIADALHGDDQNTGMKHALAEAGGGEVIEACDWPAKPFRFYDDPGKHDPCYVVMPDGAMIPLNHHAGEAVDVARAHFIVDACNAALAPEAMVRTAGAKLLTALERYGFPVSDAASTAAMSVEARDLHNAARRFKIAITSIKRPADEPAVTNGQ